MRNWIGLSLCTAAVLALGLVSAPDEHAGSALEVPFWQLHGAAPAAGDAPAVLALRAAHAETAEQIVVAAR